MHGGHLAALHAKGSQLRESGAIGRDGARSGATRTAAGGSAKGRAAWRKSGADARVARRKQEGRGGSRIAKSSLAFSASKLALERAGENQGMVPSHPRNLHFSGVNYSAPLAVVFVPFSVSAAVTRMQVSIVARSSVDVFNHICGCSVASRAPRKGEQGINRESTRRPHSVRSGHSLFRLLYRWHSHGVSSDILSRRLRHLVHVRACQIYAGAHGVDCTRNTTTVLEAGRWLCLVNGWDGTYTKC